MSDLTPEPVSAPPSAPPTIRAAGAGHRPSNWPNIVGIITIVFAVLGMLYALIMLFSAFFSEAMLQLVPDEQIEIIAKMQSEYLVWSLAIAIFYGGVSMWLTKVGIGIFKRRPLVRQSTFRWAIAKLAYVMCLLVYTYLFQVDQFQRIAEAGIPQHTNMNNWILATTAICNFAWGGALPLFLIIWFRREKIINEIHEWSKPAGTTG